MTPPNPKPTGPCQNNSGSRHAWIPGTAFPLDALNSRILHEEAGVVVVDKPPGLPTSGRTLDDADCLQFAMMKRYGQMVWAVHQLDADTSGINVFVLEKTLVPFWQFRLGHPTARKTYLAIVDGLVPFEQKRIELPIGSRPGVGLGVCAQGKHAVTQVRRRAQGVDSSLLELMIETGRTHQIRIHLAHLGYPLLGEDWYAPDRPRRHPRQALHAWKVVFTDEEAPRALGCPLPEELQELAQSLGLGRVPADFPQ